MFRKIMFSAAATTALATAALSSFSDPAHAGSRVTKAFAKTTRIVAPGGTQTVHLVPSPLPPQRPMPFPTPGNPAPPVGPAKPRPQQPDRCLPGMTKCPLLPVPYPN